MYIWGKKLLEEELINEEFFLRKISSVLICKRFIELPISFAFIHDPQTFLLDFPINGFGRLSLHHRGMYRHLVLIRNICRTPNITDRLYPTMLAAGTWQCGMVSSHGRRTNAITDGNRRRSCRWRRKMRNHLINCGVRATFATAVRGRGRRWGTLGAGTPRTEAKSAGKGGLWSFPCCVL